MDSPGKATMNAAQAQATTAAVSATSVIVSAGVARAAATCACTRKGCHACDMLAKQHPVEVIVPAAFTPRAGQAPGEGLESRVSRAMEEIKGWSSAAFRSAALQPEEDEFGRRFIEHGAMCYANCFLTLRRALGDASPPPSEAPS